MIFDEKSQHPKFQGERVRILMAVWYDNFIKIKEGAIVEKKEKFDEMLDEMEGKSFGYLKDEKPSYKEVEEDYEEMEDELSDDSDMFPNGRDYEAEDEDGV